jgi:hypothetical protein
MPKANKYVVYNVRNKLYYNVFTIGGDCNANINNASLFNEDEYQFRTSRGDYLRSDEKFAKIEENGKITIIQ